MSEGISVLHEMLLWQITIVYYDGFISEVTCLSREADALSIKQVKDLTLILRVDLSKLLPCAAILFDRLESNLTIVAAL